MLARCLGNIGQVHYDQGRWCEAVDRFDQAIEEVEHVRVRTREPSLQISFLQQFVPIYTVAIECRLKLGRPAEAFAVSERAKARAVADALGGGRVVVTKGLAAADLKREQELARLLRSHTLAREEALAPGSGHLTAELIKLESRLEAARREYAEFRRDLFLRHPYLKSQLAAYRPVSLDRLADTVFAADPNVCVLSNHLSATEAFLFVLTKGSARERTKLAVHRLKLHREQLDARVDRFQAACATPGSEYQKDWRELYESLVTLAEGDITGKSHLVIISVGSLHRLPFHALVHGNPTAHLAERFPVS